MEFSTGWNDELAARKLQSEGEHMHQNTANQHHPSPTTFRVIVSVEGGCFARIQSHIVQHALTITAAIAAAATDGRRRRRRRHRLLCRRTVNAALRRDTTGRTRRMAAFGLLVDAAQSQNMELLDTVAKFRIAILKIYSLKKKKKQ